MAVFAYRASDPEAAEGHWLKGTCSADSPLQARQRLRERGLRVHELTELRGRAASSSRMGKLPWERRPEAQVSAVVQELSTLLGAGIPLLDALDAVTSQYRGRFRANLLLVREQIAAGSSLAEALRQQPQVFDELAVCMVEVGERTGMLHEVLSQLAAYRRRGEQLRGRIGTALIYPVIVVCAGIAVMIFLSTFVVPRLLETLVEAGRPLPLITQVVKAFSDMLLQYGWAVLLGVIAAVVGCILALRRPKVRRRWHRLQLHLPLIGRLIQQQAIVRISVTLAILSRSGMEFVQALALVGKSMPNLIMQEALDRCRSAIAAGRDIGPALEATEVFPEPVVRLLEIGQATGRLDSMLERLAADYDQQVQTSTQRMLAALEPAMILLLAGMIGFIVLAVILPYLEAGNVL